LTTLSEAGVTTPFVFEEASKTTDWLHAPGEDSPDKGRRDYLTRETRETLHSAATWMVLRGKAEGRGGAQGVDWSRPDASFDFRFHSPAGRIVRFRIRPPGLILLEQSPDCGPVSEDESPLNLAFIVIEALPAAPEQPDECWPTFADVLEFNELFRYWQKHFRLADWADAFQELPVDFRVPTERVGDRCPPGVPPSGRPETQAARFVPEGTVFERWAGLVDCPIRIRDRLYSLVPEEQRVHARKWSEFKSKGTRPDPGWLLHADNRTFVWSCVLTDSPELAAVARRVIEPEGELPECMGAWIKLLNVDPAGPTSELDHCTRFERHWAGSRTHRRWAEGGTLYGYCTHAGVLLGPVSNLRLDYPFAGAYFDQALLLLYLRAALSGFSHRLAQLSMGVKRDCRPQSSSGLREYRDGFERLRFQFAIFANLYQFPLISNQQQGVELYQLLRQSLEVEGLFNEVQAEIGQSDELLSLLQQRKQGDLTLYLTVVGTVGLVAGLALGGISNSAVMDLFKSDAGVIPLGMTFLMLCLFLFVAVVVLLVVVSHAARIGEFMRRLADRDHSNPGRCPDEE
jgi:hypothetical protein